MNFSDYWKGLDIKGKNALAKKCGRSVGHLNNVAYNGKPMSLKLSIVIDAATRGRVPREVSYPDLDWHRKPSAQSTTGRRSRRPAVRRN